MVMGVNLPVYTGATCVLLYRFDPWAWALQRHRITWWWYSIAPMNGALMQVPGARDMDWSALRRNPVTSFGITFTEQLAQQWRQLRSTASRTRRPYGLSETHTVDTAMPVDAIRWGTQGQARAGQPDPIVDPTPAPLLVGTVGEITIQGPGNFKGYWNKPEATAKTLQDGWVFWATWAKSADGYPLSSRPFKENDQGLGLSSVFPRGGRNHPHQTPAVAQGRRHWSADAEKGEVVRAFIVKH